MCSPVQGVGSQRGLPKTVFVGMSVVDSAWNWWYIGLWIAFCAYAAANRNMDSAASVRAEELYFTLLSNMSQVRPPPPRRLYTLLL